MIKQLGRTFIILMVATLIALGWYTFSLASDSQMMEPPDRPAEFTQTQIDGATGDISQERPPRPEGEAIGFSVGRVLTGISANVGITALVIVLVVLFRKLVNRFTSTPFELAWFKR